MKLILHLLEKGADPNKANNRNTNSWDRAINAYCDTMRTVEDPKAAKSYAAIFREVLEALYPYVDILNIDRVNNDLKVYENYSLFLKNLILNRDDLYDVAPDMLEVWKKRWLPIIPLVKPFYMRNNPNYENNK